MKIEAVGTPLKNWDIQINYGIKTGYNDAFIITTEKRNEILSNCVSPDERKRTEELIRPILRGRDIKRYSYKWANLWLINTHNGVRGKIPSINTDEYPAIKAHLDKCWDKIVDRADQGDTPYNLRNCAYMEDFAKQKIVFQEMVQESQFFLDKKCFYCNDTARFVVGERLNFLLGVLNSKLFFFAVKHFYGGGRLGETGVRMKHSFFEEFPCIPYTAAIETYAKQLQDTYDKNIDFALEVAICKAYGLNDEEITYICED